MSVGRNPRKSVGTITVTALLALLFLANPIAAKMVGESLPIRNRIQWVENGGYCGETSLQESALYYGIYASQWWIRNVIDPTQNNELVELEEWALVLAALGLEADVFPTERIDPPQYKVFELWAKKHLARKHPVITTSYVAGVTSDNPVDHLITLTAFMAARLDAYSSDDLFILNHHLAQTTYGLPGAPFAFAQRTRWLFDERAMTGPGATYMYAIQKETDYGLAITGTSNRSSAARPVRVEVDRIDEPNLINGELPVQLAAEITVEKLTPGTSYVLYRYNDPAMVPTKNYSAHPYSSKKVFKATHERNTLQDTISSDGVAVFRCVPSRH
jgi:hypothetical protein